MVARLPLSPHGGSQAVVAPLPVCPPAYTLRPMREARLRHEFAELYPELVPGQWEPASRIVEVVLARYLLQRMTDVPVADRALNEAHFEFRSGADPPRSDRHGRADDP